MDITAFVHGNRNRAFLVGDYNSYHSQQSRQLLALRKRLGRTTPKNAKYSEKAPVTANDIASDHGYVHLLLVQAERAWAQAMHMKSSHAEDNADQRITGSTRQHIISRLHKAVTHANKLVELLQDRQTTKATDSDYLEARAYAQCLAGAEEFEKQSSQKREDPAAAWRKCIVYFSEAHVTYAALLYSSQKDLFKEVIGGTVDPSIRYAAYQSRLPRTVAVSSVAKMHFPREQIDLVSMVESLNPTAFDDEKVVNTTSKEGSSSTTSIPSIISWRGRKAPIVDAAIGQAIAATTLASSQLSNFLSTGRSDSSTDGKRASIPDARAVAAAYDPLLTAAQDTVDAVRRSIADLAREAVPESDPRMQDLRVSDLAANYTLISWRIGRNRGLISNSGTRDDGLTFDAEQPRSAKRARTSKKTQTTKSESKGRRITRLTERVVLFDATLQSIDSVKDLRGAARDTEFMSELDGKRAYFQALKCINIAYAHMVTEGHKEALALFARAQSLGRTATSSLSSLATSENHGDSRPSNLDITSTQLSGLTDHIDLLLLRQRGLVALHQYMAEDTAKLSAGPEARPVPVSDRLQEFPASGRVDLENIVAWPPRLEPIPVKPIFLDLAWNYIDYPGRAATTDEVDDAGEPMEGVVDGVMQTARQATEAVKDAVGAGQVEEKDTPKKRGWFSFGRS